MIETTSKCNLLCVYCPLTAGESSTSSAATYLPIDLLLPHIREARSVGLEEVIVGGYGEPALHPRFIDLLQSLDALEIRFSYSTNGIALPHRIASALPDLRHLVSVNVSIDVGDDATYAKIRGGNLPKVWRNLDRLCSIQGRFSVNVSAILTQSSAPHLARLVLRSAKIGVRHMAFQSLYDVHANAPAEHIVGNAVASEHIEIAEAVADGLGVVVTKAVPDRLRLERVSPADAMEQYLEDPRPQGLSRRCDVAWDWLFVDASGRAFPCCNTSAANSHVLGDVRKESLLSIWNGSRMRRFRHSLASAATCPDVCAKCSIAPAGFPASIDYSAELVDQSEERDGLVTLRYRNTGAQAWSPETSIRAGTVKPQDRLSKWATPAWLAPNRAAGMEEQLVLPGETATFIIDASRIPAGKIERLRLVVEGVIWLPRSQVAIRGKAAVQDLTTANSSEPVLEPLQIG